MFSLPPQTLTLLLAAIIFLLFPKLILFLRGDGKPHILKESNSKARELNSTQEEEVMIRPNQDATFLAPQNPVNQLSNFLDADHGVHNKRLAPKIAFKSRQQSRSCLQKNLPRKAIQALEDGLNKLKSVFTWQAKYSQIALLKDLEKFDAARENAREFLRQDLGAPVVLNGKALRTGPANSAKVASFADSFADFDNDQPSSKQIFSAAIVAEDWARGEEELNGLLAEDPKYFDGNQYVHRAQLGMLQEGLALYPEISEKASNSLMEAALQTFTIGCDMTESLRTLREPNASDDLQLTIFDRFNVCANLFMSAARICVYFQGKGTKYSKKPHEMGFDPPLTGRDWAHQALHFLETGRSRVLLDSMKSIRYHGPFDSKPSTMPSTPALMDDLDPEPSCESETPPRGQLRQRKEGFGNENFEAGDSLVLPAIKGSMSNHSEDYEMLDSDDIMFDESHKDEVGEIAPELSSSSIVPETGGDIPEIVFDFPPPARTFSKMSANVPKDTAIVVYGLASQRPHGLIVIVITTRQIELVSWTRWDETSLDRLHKDVGRLQTLMGCEDDELRPSGVIEDICVSLSSILLLPIANFLEPKTNLVVVPYGRLCHIPWPMLTLSTPKTQHLTTSTVPSFSIWDDLHSRPYSHGDTETNRQEISVVTKSEYNKERHARNPLPHARLEAVYIAWLNNTWPIPDGADKSESFAEFKARTSNARIVHVAAHGTFDKENPMLSTIDLFGGIKIVDFTKNLTIRADLVVFSTCLSGFSEVYESGLSFSFAHTLLSTGTTSFIGALWRVEDAATLLMMMEFYGALREGISPAGALYQAQKSMRSMTREKLDALVAKLEEMVGCREDEWRKLEEFVYKPKRFIQGIKDTNPEHLRRHHCWGAFLLVGYGHIPIHSTRAAV